MRTRAICVTVSLAIFVASAALLAATFTISPSSLTFAPQVLGSTSAPQSVILNNTSKKPLTFALSMTTGGTDFTATDSCGGSVAASSSCGIQVVFTPTAAGARAGVLSIVDTTKASNKMTVSLSGTGIGGGNPITLSPASVSFADTFQGATASATVAVINNQASTLTLAPAQATSPFSASGCTGSIAAGASCALTVVFEPTTAHNGTINGVLTVSAIAGGSTATANLTGVAKPPVVLSAASLNFGSTAVASTSASQILTITNYQTTRLNFGSPLLTFGGTAPGDYPQVATTCSMRLNAGASCTVTLAFRPTQGGARLATLGINTNAFGSPHTISLTGTGTAPLTVSPGALTFGSVGVGLPSASQPVTITNNQSIPVSFTSISPTTADFTKAVVGTSCGTTLAASSSCTVAVQMTPVQGGARSGLLAIASNTSTPSITVGLSGTGINAVTASVTSRTFTSQTVNTTSPAQQIVLTNHQNIASPLNTVVTGDFGAADGCSGTIPAAASCTVNVTFTPTAVGQRTGSITFASPGGPALIVALSGVGASADPPAAVASAVPGAGTIGTNVLGVVVTGNGFTHFTANSSVSFGAGITVSTPFNVTAGALTVNLAIAPNATPGARTVTVSTPLNGDTETASLTTGFVVSASDARSITSVTPLSGAQAQTVSVAIVGSGTHFQQGTSIASFGTGITVNSLTVQDQTHASANITVIPTATLGWRSVTLATGGELASLVAVDSNGPGFNVIAGSAAITNVSPPTGAQGASPFVVTVTGSSTHFSQGATQLSFGSGVSVGAITVANSTQLTVSIAVTAGAALGNRTVTATTGGEVATLADGFTVTAAPIASLSGASPNQGQQGANVPITLTGVNTHFATDLPAPSLTLGTGIVVSNLAVVNDTTVTASLAIGYLAPTGLRQGTLSSGGSNYAFGFTVSASAAAVASVSPAGGPQGGTVAISATGAATHWLEGSTAASFLTGPCPVPLVTRVTVSSGTAAVIDVAIPAGACIGAQTLQIATGGEIVTAPFSVFAQTPSVTVSPSTAMAGKTISVTISGEFSHFDLSTLAVMSGTGVIVQDLDVTSPASATATLVISPNALSGARTLTLTTALGAGAFEVLTTQFAVTTTPAVLTFIDPSHAAPGGATTVVIRGQFTNFNQQSTSVGFGPDIVVSDLVVLGPTELSVHIEVDESAAVGWRSAFVNTGAEQLAIGFHVDSQSAPAIASVSPSSGAQGESLTVQITGANTSFDATSRLILGAGVTVLDFDVTSRTTATAQVAISPTAPVGPNTVIVITGTGAGEEVAAGSGFSVIPGISSILTVTPNVAAQNQVLSVSLVGQATHWLEGATTADFGPGVAVTSLTIVDPTHATAQILVLSTAAPGFHTVTLFTDGEYASKVQGLSIQNGTPVLLSSNPNNGAQGTTFNVQVLGQLTHWVQGVTTASYGAGITTSFTVADSASGTIAVTIQPTAATGACRTLTVMTGTEQVSLPNQLCVTAGTATLLSVSPNAAPQGSTLTVHVVGQNTHFFQGLTGASFGGGINTSNVTVESETSAFVDLAVGSGASSGFRTATMTTGGEVASLGLAFNVGPNTPTLNAAAPFSGQQGQSLTVRLTGQYTHWVNGVTTVTFGGTGILVGPISVLDSTTVDAQITIDALANPGAHVVTVTTGGEIVSAAVFSVTAGGASITQVSPQSGNQGQDIVLAITGQNTNWQQGFTQFSMPGAGGDIKINYVVINSATSATVGIRIAPAAALGARSIYMSTGAEALVAPNALVITGGVPAIASVTPGSAKPGDVAVNVQIAGLNTKWKTGATTVDFGPGLTVTSTTINSDTSITAVVDVQAAAALGGRSVIVRNVTATAAQALTGQFAVVSPAPPTPFISYMSPTSGLRGQTFTVSIAAQYSHFEPGPGPLASTIDFGDPASSGITINTFEVTSPTTARVNISIAPNASFGNRTLSISTDTGSGNEVVQSAFSVVQAQPVLTIVDPSSGMQGAELTVNVIGQYTVFDATTIFNFGAGVTVTDVEILGPTAAQLTLSIDILAPTGVRSVTATTGGAAVGGAGFVVTPSQATILSLTPNTAKQQDQIAVAVVGANTHWSAGTQFSLGGGIVVPNVVVQDSTHATLTLSLDPLATLGAHDITATTGGEIASLANAFVVQPGTPLILSSTPGTEQQQGNLAIAVLGQATAWVQGGTTASLGDGVSVTAVTVTSPTSITVQGLVAARTALGYRTLTITTGAQQLLLPNALLVTPGPAVISQLLPSSAGQGTTPTITINGTNTNFAQGLSSANFGSDILVTDLQVSSATSAVAQLNIPPGAAVGQRTIFVTTEGETAAISGGFNVLLTTPSIQFASPSSAAQGSTVNVTVTGSVTNFTANTTFDFGPGTSVNSVTIVSPTQATVNVTVSPIAARTTRSVTATTGGVTATGVDLFTVSAGLAFISAVTPAKALQGQSGIALTISGNGTHFTSATPAVSLGQGVTVTQTIVDTATQLRVTVNIALSATAQFNDVVVTTGGEVATLLGGFQIKSIQAPVVNAGSDQAVHVEDTVLLAGSATDPNALPLTYVWAFVTKPAGSLATLSAATTLNASFVPDVAGDYFVGLTASNGVLEGSDVVKITAAKITPVITWGNPASITYGTLLGATQLNATANVPGAFAYTPAADTLLPAGLAHVLSVAFTPTNTAKFLPASKTVVIDVNKAPQAPLFVTGAPATQENGTSFSVSSGGGSGTGAVTFSTTGVCTNVGATVTMTSATGTCSVSAAKAGDTNYLPVVSAAATVGATGAVPPVLDILEVSGFLAVRTEGNTKVGIPGNLTIRLQSNGVSVASPGAVPFTATSDNLSCVTVTSGTIASGAFSALVPIAYGGTLTLPCQATVTIATASFGTELVPVNVHPYETAPFSDAGTSLSYYNPGLVANGAGTLSTSTSSLSYYNPATVPNPNGALFASATALSYYNPAVVPSPSGLAAAKVASLSYYNPAVLPNPAGTVSSGVASLSYCNPDEITCFSSSGFAPSALVSQPVTETEAASAVFSVSVANGPTALRITPPRLSRTAAGAVILTIEGVNLAGATGVRLLGLEQDVTLGAPVVSSDGRRVTVDVFVLSTARLGGAVVVVTGPGWSTSITAGVQVEIVQ